MAAIGSCLLSCAQLLDIPDDPRVVEEGAARGPSGSSIRAPNVDAADASSDSPLDTDIVPPAGVDGNGGGGRSGSPLMNEGGAAGLALEEGSSGASSAIGQDAGAAGEGRGNDAAAEPACDVGQSLAPDGRCYVALAALVTWDEARSACLARGAGWDLASVRSSDVNAFLAALTSAQAWIGASDTAAEGAWLWVDDGTPFWNGDGDSGNAVGGAFIAWNSDEPNGDDGSDCARMVPAQGTWADLECESLRGSLCAGPAL